MRTNMNKTIDAFVEALQPYLPGVYLTRSHSIYGGDEPYSASVDLRFANGIMQGKQHGVSRDTLLVHYTSLPALFEILKSARFRLYGADLQNDPLELVHMLEDIPGLDAGEVLQERRNLFLGSFFDYKAAEGGESFPMWRLYGQNGNGVAIVFQLVNDTAEHWRDYTLGKVAYKKGAETIATLKELFDLVRSYREGTYKIENTPSVLYAYALLNKTGIWEGEGEIRLIHYKKIKPYEWLYNNARSSDDPPLVYPSVTPGGHIRYFSELRLDLPAYKEELRKRDLTEEWRSIAFNLYPALQIDKVILGYNFSGEQLHLIGEHIQKLTRLSLGYEFPVLTSGLTKYFQQKMT